MCYDSLLEAARNCDKSFLTTLNRSSLFETQLLSKYNTSYVSNNTFFENKHGFPEYNLNNEKLSSTSLIIRRNAKFHIPYVFYKGLSDGLRRENRFSFDIQIRGFKTDRNIKVELQRNPPLLSRIKSNLGMQGTDIDLKMPETLDANKMKQLLSNEDSTLNESEKQRIKIAFAEGYLLGNNATNKTGKAARYFKILQQVLTVVIFLAIVISLMASANGSMFRIQLGNQVEVDPEEIHVTFDDVKGADEAKQELKDVVEFLKNPEKFSNLGGKLPKGVLLVGPPGNTIVYIFLVEIDLIFTIYRHW